MILLSKLLPVWSTTRAIIILPSKLLPVWSNFRETTNKGQKANFFREIALFAITNS